MKVMYDVFKQLWEDERLKWSPEDYGGIPYIELPSTKVWKPVVGLRNR